MRVRLILRQDGKYAVQCASEHGPWLTSTETYDLGHAERDYETLRQFHECPIAVLKQAEA